MHVVLVLEQPSASMLAGELTLEGVHDIAVFPPQQFAVTIASGHVIDGEMTSALASADVVVLPATVQLLTAHAVSFADRAGIRLVPLGVNPSSERLVAAFGLVAPLDAALHPRDLAHAILTTRPTSTGRRAALGPRTIAVWGTHGAPGRTTLSISLAVELSRGRRHVALIDADTHAPSMALALGIPDEGPGFAVACRQAELGILDDVELQRLCVPLAGADDVDVFAGINRPSRWPELSRVRVRSALTRTAEWAEQCVIDVAASIETDEEIVSDVLDGPRRNAATLQALESADHIVAVLGADPVGVARFVRAFPEVGDVAGATPITIVVNRLRSGAVGFDARQQIRRTLERYLSISEIWFVPEDRRAADAALLAGKAIAVSSPRSPIVAAVRRFVGESNLGGAL